MTFLESQTAVGELINQAVTDDTLSVTLTSVKRNLNFAYKQVVNMVMLVSPNYYGDIVTADLVATQDIYQLPTNCAKLVKLEIGYNDSTHRYPAKRESIQEKENTTELYPNDSNDPSFQDFGNYIIIDPIPTVAVTAGLRFYYLKHITDLSANADTYDLPVGYESLPIMYAVSKAKLTLGLESEAQADMAEFRAGLSTMRTEIFNRSEMAGNSSVMIAD